MTNSLILTSAPLEGVEVDPGEPVDELGQDKDHAEPDDGDGHQGGGVQAAEVEEVGQAGKVAPDEVVDGAEGDREEGDGEREAQLE